MKKCRKFSHFRSRFDFICQKFIFSFKILICSIKNVIFDLSLPFLSKIRLRGSRCHFRNLREKCCRMVVTRAREQVCEPLSQRTCVGDNLPPAPPRHAYGRSEIHQSESNLRPFGRNRGHIQLRRRWSTEWSLAPELIFWRWSPEWSSGQK